MEKEEMVEIAALFGIIISLLYILYRHRILTQLFYKYKMIDPKLITLDALIFVAAPFISVTLFSSHFYKQGNLFILELIKPLIPLITFIIGIQFQKLKEKKSDRAVSYALFDDLISNLCILSLHQSTLFNSIEGKDYYQKALFFNLLDELNLDTWKNNKIEFYREHNYKNETLLDGSRVESGGIIITENGSNNTKQLVANIFNRLITYNNEIVKLNQIIINYNDKLKTIDLSAQPFSDIIIANSNLRDALNQILNQRVYLLNRLAVESNLIKQSIKELSYLIHE